MGGRAWPGRCGPPTGTLSALSMGATSKAIEEITTQVRGKEVGIFDDQFWVLQMRRMAVTDANDRTVVRAPATRNFLGNEKDAPEHWHPTRVGLGEAGSCNEPVRLN